MDSTLIKPTGAVDEDFVTYFDNVRHSDVQGNIDALDEFLPWYVRILKIFNYKPMTYASFFSLAVCALIVALHLGIAKDSFLRFLPIAFGETFVAMLMVGTLMVCKIWEKTRQTPAVLIYDITAMNPLLKKQIRDICKPRERWLFVEIIMNTIVILLLAYTLFEDAALIFFGERTMSKWWISLTFTLLVGFCHFILAISVSLVIYYMYYFAIIVQIELLTLRNYTLEFAKSLESPRKNKQSYVGENLKYLITIHQKILKQRYFLHDKFTTVFIIIHVAVSMIVMCSIFLEFSSYYGIYPGCLGFGLMIVRAYHITGDLQEHEDQNEELCTLLYDLEWYEWDPPNQKDYGIFLLNARKEIVLHLTPLIKFNREYFKKIVQLIWTMGNAAYSLNHR